MEKELSFRLFFKEADDKNIGHDFSENVVDAFLNVPSLF